MNTPIYLKSQTERLTIKIKDEMTDGPLPPEVETIEPVIAERLP